MDDYTYIHIADPKYNRFVSVLVEACKCGNSERFASALVNRNIHARCVECGDDRIVGNLEPKSLPNTWVQDLTKGEINVARETSDGR